MDHHEVNHHKQTTVIFREKYNVLCFILKDFPESFHNVQFLRDLTNTCHCKRGVNVSGGVGLGMSLVVACCRLVSVRAHAQCEHTGHSSCNWRHGNFLCG